MKEISIIIIILIIMYYDNNNDISGLLREYVYNPFKNIIDYLIKHKSLHYEK